MASVMLLALDPPKLQTLIDSTEEFERQNNVSLGNNGALAREMAKHTRDALRRNAGDPGWWGYLALDTETRTAVGSCGFKGSPNAAGIVEIAYITFPDCEGSGYATEMARILVNVAFSSGSVKRVVAHTLPEHNASTRVLEKAGFRLLGEHHDLEDGTAWRWTLEGPR